MLFRFQLRHIYHASINILTSVLFEWQWHGILWISWSPTRYLIILQLWRCVLWISGWLLTNQGQRRWINDWIIQWMRHRYHQWWQIVDLWVTFLSIKAPVITRSCSLTTLIFPCSNFMATTNTLWTWHDEWNMSLWWCCVPLILFVYRQRRMREKNWRDNCSRVWV